MTTILGFQGEGFAILGADSQITDGDKRIISPSTPKIVKIGKYLLAVQGDCRPGDILMYNWKPPAYDGTDPVKFMGRKIIPSILLAFKTNGYDPDKEGNSFGYLLAFAGNIFQIGDALDINQTEDGIYGIGSGSAFGLGALKYALTFEAGILAATVASSTDAIHAALAIAADNDINTAAPFQVEIQR